MFDAHGKTAFISGGASGIGLAIGTAFAKAGMKVAIGDIDATRIEPALAQLRELGTEAFGCVLDVREPASWQGAADAVEAAIGPVHVLINNAGVGSARRPLWEIDPEDWRWIFGINVDGLLNGIRTYIPRMRQLDTRCHVVNTVSIMGMFARGFSGDYVASKYAALGIAETLRFELLDTNIGVSVLMPAHVRTSLAGNTAASRPSTKAGRAAPPAYAKPGGLVGIDPGLVGQLVLDAVVGGNFYIWTNPEYLVPVKRRMAEIEATMSAMEIVQEPQDVGYLAGDVMSKIDLNIGLQGRAVNGKP